MCYYWHWKYPCGHLGTRSIHRCIDAIVAGERCAAALDSAETATLRMSWADCYDCILASARAEAEAEAEAATQTDTAKYKGSFSGKYTFPRAARGSLHRVADSNKAKVERVRREATEKAAVEREREEREREATNAEAQRAHTEGGVWKAAPGSGRKTRVKRGGKKADMPKLSELFTVQPARVGEMKSHSVWESICQGSVMENKALRSEVVEDIKSEAAKAGGGEAPKGEAPRNEAPIDTGYRAGSWGPKVLTNRDRRDGGKK